MFRHEQYQRFRLPWHPRGSAPCPSWPWRLCPRRSWASWGCHGRSSWTFRRLHHLELDAGVAWNLFPAIKKLVKLNCKCTLGYTGPKAIGYVTDQPLNIFRVSPYPPIDILFWVLDRETRDVWCLLCLPFHNFEASKPVVRRSWNMYIKFAGYPDLQVLIMRKGPCGPLYMTERFPTLCLQICHFKNANILISLNKRNFCLGSNAILTRLTLSQF